MDDDPYGKKDYCYLRKELSERTKFKTQKLIPAKTYEQISIPADKMDAHLKELEIPGVSEPVVSIIIPVYNNIKYTSECLLSISKHTDLRHHEILIIDDGSTDETEKVLGSIENLKYIRNQKNLGFLRSCNLAAREARGRFLLFLNNDTQVTENWLQPFLDIFSDYKNVGVVGPKVLFPDRRLQEAGALINRDCSTELIGLGDDPDLPRYNYIREVDYCSGVCLMVETQVFRDLGGFDEGFAPAYCEDVDLCLRIRQRDLRIFYNPRSVIIHHLSATSDSIDEGNFKYHHIVCNQQKLSEKWQEQIDAMNRVRLIAFYLPQFHPIPENDRWWGRGFTEWRNVTKARPNFEGHYQPHLPADLGFYDLRIEEVMEQQAELARRYGIAGFCYYYYRFGNKRLLEMPLERILKKNIPDFPFCICWANENWTRRWDGQEHEVLMGQHHSDEDDHAVILDMIRYLRHPNYIRINDKPLLLIYRINLFPDIKRTTEIWRDVCHKEGIGEIYLAMVESFEHSINRDHPSKFGFDASVEFPPHGLWTQINPPGEVLNQEFSGRVFDYHEVVMKYVQREIPGYVRFAGVMPSWDNTPRRQRNPDTYAHASPGAYQAWLEAVLEQTRRQNSGDERIVFINAWNEWAEGTYLEPDHRFGHGFLEATYNALERALLKA